MYLHFYKNLLLEWMLLKSQHISTKPFKVRSETDLNLKFYFAERAIFEQNILKIIKNLKNKPIFF